MPNPWTTLAVLVIPAITAVFLAVFGRRAWREREVGALIPVLVMLALEVVALVGSHNERHYWDGWELDVSSTELTAADFVGTWQRGEYSMSLGPDRTFRSRSGSNGTWSFEGSYLVIGGQNWWVLRRDGKLVLLPPQEVDDPDAWNKWTCWERGG